MKRIIIVAIAISSVLMANAQEGNKKIVKDEYGNVVVETVVVTDTITETVTIREPMKPVTYINVGLGLVHLRYDGKDRSPLDDALGYSLVVGHQFPLGKSRCYYALEGGIASRSVDDIVQSHGVVLTPVMLGWKPMLSEKLQLDLSIGAYASYDFIGTLKGSRYSDDSWSDLIKQYDYGMQLNGGVWFTKQLYGGLKYNYGMAPIFSESWNDDFYSTKIELSFRYAF